ncbi:hydroxymethylglutaryl-CoA synthase [Candidatus Curtissbacteria bacterium RIFCSPHIGHO2_01_FULL_41_11]|uniref:Hydroxymethylglutaryl-CoA synthase n=1 Tax=Candidatus Curtissbacteria bacterium RIFCSPHIGHO2_01_FULL_41_11 TaxID=1797711 RepID=A0A1F5G8K6_9BACT|nr:MAG: hydroxymethylglutaryl-CoA synthase [Candidatus Curtissbacteria bacterium RIFCSPHIGHO2_01_FULL_41_11]
MTGIISYGTYIPYLRLKVEDIASFWSKDAQEIKKNLGIYQKSVASADEDSITMAAEAAIQAIERANISPTQLEAIVVGSESHPYSVKPSSTIVGEILGVGNIYQALDTEFACKAATAALELIAGITKSKNIYGLVIGSDTAQSRPGDPLEYTAASGAAAFILNSKDSIANIYAFTSYSSNTPDFWRRDGQKYPSHGGRFTGEPAYFHHVESAANQLLSKLKARPSDFNYAVFHMPNSKFPTQVAKKLGFTSKQIEAGFIIKDIGNPYSASSLIGLAKVLDIAKPNQKIFVCSYGSGAGSDAFAIETTPKITAFQKAAQNNVQNQLDKTKYCDYAHYLKIVKSRNYHL